MINLASILSICTMTTPGLHCASFDVSSIYYSFQPLKKQYIHLELDHMPDEDTPAQHKSSKTATYPYVHRLPNIDWQAAGVVEGPIPNNPAPPDQCK